MQPTERWPHSRCSWLIMRPPFVIELVDRKVASLKVLLAYHETSIRDQTGRSKGGLAQGAWLTMRPPFAINWPTERWPRSRCSWLIMRPPFAIKLADWKVASLKVLLAYHEISIRDQTDRPKGGLAQGALGSPWDLNSRSTDRSKGGFAQGALGLSWDLHSRSNWPTERWLRSRCSSLTMRPFTIELADQKVASLKVLPGHHETSDQQLSWSVKRLLSLEAQVTIHDLSRPADSRI